MSDIAIAFSKEEPECTGDQLCPDGYYYNCGGTIVGPFKTGEACIEAAFSDTCHEGTGPGGGNVPACYVDTGSFECCPDGTCQPVGNCAP